VNDFVHEIFAQDLVAAISLLRSIMVVISLALEITVAMSMVESYGMMILTALLGLR
jgi:hypothetical protein